MEPLKVVTPKAAFLNHLGRNCMVLSCIAYVDTVSVTIPDLLWELYSSKLGCLCCHCQCCKSCFIFHFCFIAGHQLTEHERDELLATTAYFFVQRSLRAKTFKNQEK